MCDTHPIVPNKYRGTIFYHLVFKELITASLYRGTVTYQKIAYSIGLPSTGNRMGAEIGHLLGEISEDEFKQDRPMLSAVAVNNSGQPGPGFYLLAEHLGKLGENSTKEEKARFWEKEREEVYKKWKIKKNSSK
jgi:hypothetical protein